MKIIQLVNLTDTGITTGGGRVGWWCGDRKVACWALCERDDGSRVVWPIVPNRGDGPATGLVPAKDDWPIRFNG